jgi:hypothetical protein
MSPKVALQKSPFFDSIDPKRTWNATWARRKGVDLLISCRCSVLNLMANAGSGQKLKVFISYSRRDSSDFADELVAGLELIGFAPFLDRHDVAAGEEWEARLGSLIQQADTVVYVISPEAVKSERCEWEVNRALAQSKRLMPVIFKPVAEPEMIPEKLRSRQFIRFDIGFGIARPLAQLADALRQDIDWIREHTRLGELAIRWEERGHPGSLLLRSDDLAAAQAWANQWKPGAPAISDSVRTFITASKQAEAASLAKSHAAKRRAIRMQVLVSVLTVGVIVGLIGWMNQSYIRDKWHWYTATRPYMLTQFWPYVLTKAREEALRAGDSFRECLKDCPEMVVIPTGSFMMGTGAAPIGGLLSGENSYEQPQHHVAITRAIAVSKFEVTFADWDACAAYGGCDSQINDDGFGRGEQPVIKVTWADAKSYVVSLTPLYGAA